MKTPIVEIDNVTYYYSASKTPAIQNINLKIFEGEFVLITGPSGCGKSTLCRLMNGLIPHFFSGKLYGKVLIKGLDTRKTPTHVLAKYVGMVFQNPENQLFLSSVEREIAFGLENLGLPKLEIKRRVNEILELFDLEDIKDKAPYELSGGQQQKVALAAILAMKPEILVLDEPTSNLDPKSAEEILNMIHKLNKEFNLTIVLVEHRLDMVSQYVDRIIIMNKGKILIQGSPRDVLIKEGIDEIGIAIPKVISVYKGLKRRGFSLENIPLSPEELALEIQIILKNSK